MTKIKKPLIEGVVEDFLENSDQFEERTIQFIRDNPLTAVLAALALGYCIARIVRKERVIYMEKVNS